LLVFAAALLALAPVRPAAAGIVDVTATGSISFISPELMPDFSYGQQVTIHFSFDDSAAGTPVNPNRVIYYAATEADVATLGFSASSSFSGSGGDNPIDIRNDEPNGGGVSDSWEFGAFGLNGAALPAGITPEYVIGTLAADFSDDPAHPPTLLTSTLLTQPVPIHNLDGSTWSIYFRTAEQASVYIEGSIDAASLPEPATVALCALAFAALGTRRGLR